MKNATALMDFVLTVTSYLQEEKKIRILGLNLLNNGLLVIFVANLVKQHQLSTRVMACVKNVTDAIAINVKGVNNL